MLILLPPSEGKAASGSGAPLDLAGLCLPSLTPARERVLDTLVALCAPAGTAPTGTAPAGTAARKGEDR